MADPITFDSEQVQNDNPKTRQIVITRFIDFGVDAIVDGDLEFEIPYGYHTVVVSSELAGAATLDVTGFLTDEANEVGSQSSQQGVAGRTNWTTRGFRKLLLELRGNGNDALLMLRAYDAVLP